MLATTDKPVSVAPTGTTCPAGDNAVSVVHVLLHRHRRGEPWKEIDADPDPEKLWDRFVSLRMGGAFLLRTRPPDLADAPAATG